MVSQFVIETRNLSKSYPKSDNHPIFHNLNIGISAGQITVLLGRSGSGKTTFLNLISGIDVASSGEVYINGICINKLNERERTLFRRRHIGFVFQFYNLIPTLTVEENLLLPLELNRLTGPAHKKQALEMLERFAIAGRRDAYPDQLSGGEQQRVAIARALVHDPVLILADEPTGNLDLDTGREVLAALDRAVREHGTTMIMVTHATEVIGMADRILRVSGTTLREEPPP